MNVPVTRLDPESTKGREVAERFGQTLAEIITEVIAEERAEQRKQAKRAKPAA